MLFETHKKILILSPHTDDAELGCGGTISKLVTEGHKILWVCFSTAEESLPSGFAPDALKNEFQEVMSYLGLKKNSYKIYDYRVRKLSEHRQAVLENLIEIKKEFNPEIVFGPSINDFHQDHGVVANEMIRAFKSSASIFSYELPWNHLDFKTQFFVKLEKAHLEKKLKMLEFYKTQFVAKRNYFTKEFIQGLANVRGAQINQQYAECFEVIRSQIC